MSYIIETTHWNQNRTYDSINRVIFRNLRLTFVQRSFRLISIFVTSNNSYVRIGSGIPRAVQTFFVDWYVAQVELVHLVPKNLALISLEGTHGWRPPVGFTLTVQTFLTLREFRRDQHDGCFHESAMQSDPSSTRALCHTPSRSITCNRFRSWCLFMIL